MGSRTRRRFRAPVISRLTLAWAAFGAAGVAIAAFGVYLGRSIDLPTRVAIALDGEAQNLAPPPAAPRETTAKDATPNVASVESIPGLRDGESSLEPYSVDAEDALAYAGSAGAPVIEPEEPLVQPADIVITIDGAPAQAPGARVLAPELASASAPEVRIPDPESALLQKTPLGSIPRVASNGRRASAAYARPAPTAKGPQIGIVVGGLGLNPALTERAIDELPAEVSLSFAPYAKDLAFWTKKARDDGHEIIIELPMEGYGGDEKALGPAALTTGRTADENLQRLDWLLARFGGYFAATNYLGGKFSADREALAPVLRRLDEIGVAYIDDTGAVRRALGREANAGAVNRLIGAGAREKEAALRDIKALETLAETNGYALGKAYAYDSTIEAIAEWANGDANPEIVLAPASAVLRAQRSEG